MPPARIDEARLKQFMGKYVNDMGGAFMMAMLVEPFAGNDLAENSNPVGRLYYAASTMICTPNSLSQEVGLGLGAQAGERRLAAVMAEAGYRRFRRATETPFNLIFEARK